MLHAAFVRSPLPHALVGSIDVAEAVRHLRLIGSQLRDLVAAPVEERVRKARELGAPLDLVSQVAEAGRLPVPNFAAGGIATPADAALVMSLGAEAVFVGSGIFKSEQPERTAAAIVRATARYQDPEVVLDACRQAGSGAMRGLAVASLEAGERLQERGA